MPKYKPKFSTERKLTLFYNQDGQPQLVLETIVETKTFRVRYPGGSMTIDLEEARAIVDFVTDADEEWS
jgi:hypothetical protein